MTYRVAIRCRNGAIVYSTPLPYSAARSVQRGWINEGRLALVVCGR